MKCWAAKSQLIITCIGMLMFGNSHIVQAEKAVEKVPAYQIKAAFIYNFTQFVEWPATAFANATAPIEIGIFGKDPFGNAIDAIMQGVRVQGRPIVVRRATQLTALQSCQIIFISRSEAKFLPEMLRKIKNQPILTISDMDEFARKDGMIGFISHHDTVRFQINLKMVRNAQLKVSSNVLRLAEIIEGSAEDE